MERFWLNAVLAVLGVVMISLNVGFILDAANASVLHRHIGFLILWVVISLLNITDFLQRAGAK